MEFETEFDYISPYSGSDSVPEESTDDSLIISTDWSGDEDVILSPDAIVENESETYTGVIFPEIENDTVSEDRTTEVYTPVENDNSTADNNTLSEIYNLLDSRLPERSGSETEAIQESESEEEITISDVYDKIDSVIEFESEQAVLLSEIRDNNIISNNNDYYMASFQIALMSAIFGSILIYLLFRKIG